MATSEDEAQVHSTIEKLVAEEHELWGCEAAGDASESDRSRLDELKVSLDQCWDLLRQSGARFGKPGATPIRRACGRPTSSSATSSETDAGARGRRGRRWRIHWRTRGKVPANRRFQGGLENGHPSFRPREGRQPSRLVGSLIALLPV
jgi:hypothetical protein